MKLVGALSPVSHKGLHQGWTQTSFYLQVLISQVITPQLAQVICFLSLFIFCGHSTWEPASSKMTFLFRVCTKELVLAAANTEKTWERFWKNAGEWTGRVKIRKKSLAISIACMAIYWPTPGFKGRTFQFYVLNLHNFPNLNKRKLFLADLHVLLCHILIAWPNWQTSFCSWIFWLVSHFFWPEKCREISSS